MVWARVKMSFWSGKIGFRPSVFEMGRRSAAGFVVVIAVVVVAGRFDDLHYGSHV